MYIKLLAALKQVSYGMFCSFHYNYNTFSSSFCGEVICSVLGGAL
jgi:hypothetical protein